MEYTLDDEGGDNPILFLADDGCVFISVFRTAQQKEHPFNADRTARMIEKMEELLEFARDSTDVYHGGIAIWREKKKWLFPQDNGISRLNKILNYIESGDKEEMVEVAVCGKRTSFIEVKGRVVDVHFHKIPKSEAIRLKIIKE